MTKTPVRSFGKGLCGRQATLQEAATVRQFPLFAGILSSSKRHAKLKAKEWRA